MGNISSPLAARHLDWLVMSNHFHLVLYVDMKQASEWTRDEVIDRWMGLYKEPSVVKKYKAGELLGTVELKALELLVEVWRNRLADLSWYMRCLNEKIARMANVEDGCTGRFWEGRFKSQALLDEAALISCMAYVDLNPIRAGICESLESSDFTSIQERQSEFKKGIKPDCSPWLKPLRNEKDLPTKASLPLLATSYFALVDWTGRAVRDDKKGAIPEHIQPILQRLGVNQDNWVNNTQHFGSRFRRAIGRINQIRKLAFRTDQHWINGFSSTSAFYH